METEWTAREVPTARATGAKEVSAASVASAAREVSRANAAAAREAVAARATAAREVPAARAAAARAATARAAVIYYGIWQCWRVLTGRRFFDCWMCIPHSALWPESVRIYHPLRP